METRRLGEKSPFREGERPPLGENSSLGERPSLEEAYRYCAWITYHHYENFPVASWILPKDKRPFIAAIYAFARSADDFADEAKYRGRSLELLAGWRKALWSCTDGAGGADGELARHPIFLALGDAIQRCGLSVKLLDDLLTAFCLDVTKRRYANWEELLTYCRYSANPVGRLVLTVFGYQDKELHRLSDSICTGLQLANHWQDLSLDLARDLCYIPEELLRTHGLAVAELKGRLTRSDAAGPAKGLPPNVRALMKELVSRARELFNQGEPLLSQVWGPLRLELKLTVSGGRAILDRIEASGYDVFRRRVVLSPWTKARLLVRALLPL